MKKNKKSSLLDERQEQVLLQIEHNGCWIAFWGLLIAFFVEQFIFGYDFKAIAGEWSVFMILTVYLGAACTKAGIWDRRLKPNFKTNFILSLIAGLASGSVMGIGIYLRFHESILPGILSGAFMGGIVFVSCLILLSLTARSMKKKLAEQEKELDEEEDEN